MNHLPATILRFPHCLLDFIFRMILLENDNILEEPIRMRKGWTGRAHHVHLKETPHETSMQLTTAPWARIGLPWQGSSKGPSLGNI